MVFVFIVDPSFLHLSHLSFFSGSFHWLLHFMCIDFFHIINIRCMHLCKIPLKGVLWNLRFSSLTPSIYSKVVFTLNMLVQLYSDNFIIQFSRPFLFACCVYACLDTCCCHFVTIIAGVHVELHFRHESELPVCQTEDWTWVAVVLGEAAYTTPTVL